MLICQESQFLVTCDKCRATTTTFETCDIEAAREELARAGWRECERDGFARDRWDWCCPACTKAA